MFSLAAILVAISCGKSPEEKPVVQPEINIPAESQAIFSSGISFPEYSGTSAQTASLSFTATESWSTDVSDTKASSWLSVQPSSGGAGTVNMTVSAQPNTGETARSGKVTIKCGTVSKSFSVTQAGNPPAVIAVESVTIDKTELALVEGDEVTLSATVKPDNATDKTVTWSSSDENIATVEKGKVKAIKEGSVTITAKAGEKSATCKVTVAKKVIPVESVTLNKTQLNLNKGETETLVATVLPNDATDKTVTWSSSNPDIAIVENGKVAALGGGSASIEARAGDKSAVCEVIVTVPVESITLNINSITLDEEQTTTLTATVNPSDATNKTVTWTTSDASIVTVDNGTITAIKEGKATITAKAGEKTAECKVTVDKKVIAVSSVELNKNSLDLKKGESETLIATVKPDDATDKTVTWSSSDVSIATVDQSGKVTAKKTGKATITAKAGDKSSTCTVTVTTPVESITLNQATIHLEVGNTETLIATINPSDADEKTIGWSSSDVKIASVANGVVTALAEGTCTITAMAGGKTATCQVSITLVPNGGNEGIGYEGED
jgi:uncharacterized protein YjdB